MAGQFFINQKTYHVTICYNLSMKWRGGVKFIIIITATLVGYFAFAFFEAIISEPIVVNKISEKKISRPGSLGLNYNTTVTAFVLPPNAKVATYIFTSEDLNNEMVQSSPLISQEVKKRFKENLFINKNLSHWIEDRGGAQIGIYVGDTDENRNLIQAEALVLDFQIAIIENGAARELIDLGVDLVIKKSNGRFEDAEIYNSSLIINSLGYFWPNAPENDLNFDHKGAYAKISFITEYGIDYSLVPINTFKGVVEVGF